MKKCLHFPIDLQLRQHIILAHVLPYVVLCIVYLPSFFSKNLFRNILIILGGNRTLQLRYNITIINPFKTLPSSLTIIPTQPHVPIFAPGLGRCVPPSRANAFYHFAHPMQGFEDLSHRQTLLVSYFGQLTCCHLWWLLSLSVVLSRSFTKKHVFYSFYWPNNIPLHGYPVFWRSHLASTSKSTSLPGPKLQSIWKLL